MMISRMHFLKLIPRGFKFIFLSLFTLIFTVCIFLLPVSSAPSKATVDATVPIHVIGRIRLDIPGDKYEEYKLKTAALFEKTAELDKPRLYTCNQDINDPNLFVWNEVWPSYDALEAHLASLHFNDWYSYVKRYQVGKLNVIYAPTSAFKNV